VTWQVLSLVLIAAFIHAGWNAWLKLSGDRLVTMALMGAGWSLFSAAWLPFVEAPFDVAWPYLVPSVFVHVAYTLSLVAAYRFGDLSVAYPIARGTAPLLVSLFSAVLAGEALDLPGSLAVLLIVSGVIGLGLTASVRDHRVVTLSLFNGGMIAAYTLLDGMGARASGSAHGYALWIFVCTGIPVFAVGLAAHGSRFAVLARPIWIKALSAGGISAAAFWIVIWAMTAAPMGLVSAVRESSVAFVAVLGGFVFKERVRWVAVLAIVCGIVLSRLAGQ
jgi:multidrug transporter EmrE-like cation transporter